MKKLLSFILCIALLFTACSFYVYASADQPTPYWTNTEEVIIIHQYENGKSRYQVEITGYSGTTLIDNVDLRLYRIVDEDLMVLDGWIFNLSQTGEEFFYAGVFENVLRGFTYRLKVTADIHRNGTVESIDCYFDVRY